MFNRDKAIEMSKKGDKNNPYKVVNPRRVKRLTKHILRCIKYETEMGQYFYSSPTLFRSYNSSELDEVWENITNLGFKISFGCFKPHDKPEGYTQDVSFTVSWYPENEYDEYEDEEDIFFG